MTGTTRNLFSPKPVLTVMALLALAAAIVLVAPASASITSFEGGTFDQEGNQQIDAGTHPYSADTNFLLDAAVTPGGVLLTTEPLKDTIVKLPPGVVGNPQAVPTCPLGTFVAGARECPPQTQVGYLIVVLDPQFFGGERTQVYSPLYNLVPPDGTPAMFGFTVNAISFTLFAKVRSDGDYGVTVINRNAQETLPIGGASAFVWGVPADPSHDKLRGECLNAALGVPTGDSCPSPDSADPKAFFTLPTSCTGPVDTFLTTTTWFDTSYDASFSSPSNTGCAALDFSPTLEAHPTTNVADSPSGLDFDLHIPQDDIANPNLPVEAHLKDATVTLPEGLVINPSGANGLEGCSPAQAGLLTPIGATPIHFSADGANCPDSSKVGTAEVDTPLLDHPLPGAMYVAAPYDNPFNSLIAVYIAVKDARSGISATLAGEVHADPATGQLSTTVKENPQLPVEDVKLSIFGGSHGSLRTPQSCGIYTIDSELTPWSAANGGGGEVATPSSSWQIAHGPQGPCANSVGEMPNAPNLDAGTVSPLSKSYSPFVLHLRREDGTQNFKTITLSPPPGLVAKLAGTSQCADGALAAAEGKSGREEQQSPSCPLDSRIGTVDAAAGAGPSPYHVPGIAYLAGPYKGAPLSMAIVTPAVAGPFDLGTIVIRSALYVDPVTARITAVSDPIPAILEGIPTDVRSADLTLDKPDFTLTGTSCDPGSVDGSLTSTLEQSVPLSVRFQLSDCGRLGFKPKMSLFLRGGTKRGKHPALTVVLMPRPGDANIASLQLAMPRSEFLENAHIKTICTRVQFAADECPGAAVYGRAVVRTKLFDFPLAGNVYLRSSDNVLPDLVPDLRGPSYLPVKVESAGKTDSIRGGIRNTFSFVPDAPFTKLVTRLPGGKKGLLVNSRNICAHPYRATVRYRAHNGDTYVAHPKLRVKCKKRKAKGQRLKRAHGKHRPSRLHRLRAAR